MTPAAIILQAQADGVRLSVSPTGTIKATGNGEVVTRWVPIIREHKAELLAALGSNGGSALRQQQVAELTRLMRMYAGHNSFSQADYEEAIGTALRNVEGWLIYLRTQPECRTVQ